MININGNERDKINKNNVTIKLLKETSSITSTFDIIIIIINVI